MLPREKQTPTDGNSLFSMYFLVKLQFFLVLHASVLDKAAMRINLEQPYLSATRRFGSPEST